MAVTHGHGNPNWTREETLLALDLYFDCHGLIPSGSDERVISLSRLLRELPYHTHAARKESFRNVDGVTFKLQNLRQVATGKGLGNVSNMDRIIWSEFGNKPTETKKQANLIRAGIAVVEMLGDDSDDELEFAEGRMVTEAHKRRERNPRLRSKLIAKRRRSGSLSCDLCNCVQPAFVFGEAIFEVHHISPLAAAAERLTKLRDLALLCANCHRIIHRAIAHQKKWLTVMETKAFLEAIIAAEE